MCYPVFVILEHCEEGHPNHVRLCWRQCQTRSVESYQTGRWNNLCTTRDYTTLPVTQIYSPGATQNEDCTICDGEQTKLKGEQLNAKLQGLMVPYNTTKHSIEGFEEQLRETEYRINNERMSQYERSVLRGTVEDLNGRIDILHQMQSRRQPAIDKYKEELAAIEDEIEEDFHTGRLKDAIENFKSEGEPKLIYFGSFPIDDEKKDRRRYGDYPRHIAPKHPDAPMDEWGVFQKVYEGTEEDDTDEEMTEEDD